MATECRTGVGRLVWGNPQIPQKKIDRNTKLPVLKDGQPVMQYAYGVAYPKAEFQSIIWPLMSAEIATIYSQGVPPNFSYKYKDGDGVDSKGKPYSAREGYAGCFVLNVATEAYQPPLWKWNPATQQYEQVPDGGIKTGDYIAQNLSFQVNKPKDTTHTPSLYVNPRAIELVAYGTPIIAMADPTEMFGPGGQRQLPPGASLTPISGAPAGVGMPGQMPGGMQPGGMMPGQQPQVPVTSGIPGQMPGGMPQQQPGMGMPGQMPAMGGQPMQPQGMPGYAPPQQGVQPAHDYTQGLGGQQPQGMPGQMPGGMQPGGMMPGQMPQQQPGMAMPGQMPGGMPGMPGFQGR